MIKRISIVLIATVNLISVSGVVGSNFYCCGKYKESYFFTHISKGSNCNEDFTAKDCCVTKIFSLKVKDNHSPSQVAKTNGMERITFLNPFFSDIVQLNNTSDDQLLSIIIHPPPKVSKLPVYLSNEVFLI